MEDWLVAIFVPVIVFIVIVAPIWIILHYKSISRTADGLSSGERAELDDMIEVADRMAARIETLEAILDVDNPDWREEQRQA